MQQLKITALMVIAVLLLSSAVSAQTDILSGISDFLNEFFSITGYAPADCPTSSSTCRSPDGSVSCGKSLSDCLNKYDWKYYRVPDSAGKQVTVTLTHSGTGCNANDLYIYDNNCRRLNISSGNGWTDTWTGTSSSDIIIGIDGDSSNSNCQWTLTVDCGGVTTTTTPTTASTVPTTITTTTIPTGIWVSPTGYQDSSGQWSNPEYAYDDSTSTHASCGTGNEYTPWLELTFDSDVECSKVRFYAKSNTLTYRGEIDLYYSGAWHNVWTWTSCSAYTWNESPSFAAVVAEKARIRIKTPGSYNRWLYEVEFWGVSTPTTTTTVPITTTTTSTTTTSTTTTTTIPVTTTTTITSTTTTTVPTTTTTQPSTTTTTSTTSTTTIPTCDSNLVGHCTSYDGITAIGQTQVFDAYMYSFYNSSCGGENWCIGINGNYATRAFTGLALSNADVDVSVDVWGLHASTTWQIWISNDNSAWTQCGDTYVTPSGSTTYTMSRTCSGFTGTEMYVKVIMTSNAGNVRESINNFRVVYPPCGQTTTTTSTTTTTTIPVTTTTTITSTTTTSTIPTGVWISPTGYNDPSGGWSSEGNAYDDDTSTYAKHDYTENWSSYLELVHSAIDCSKIRFYAFYGYESSKYHYEVDVDVYYDSDWHDVYQGSYANKAWVEKSLGTTAYVTKARIRFNPNAGMYSRYPKLYEFDFYGTTTTIPGYVCLGGNQLVGDANNDGSINMADVTAIERAILFGIGNQPICCGDVNNDGSINMADVTAVERYILGVANCFPRGYSCSRRENCIDGIDNDCDGDVDGADSDCSKIKINSVYQDSSDNIHVYLRNIGTETIKNAGDFLYEINNNHVIGGCLYNLEELDVEAGNSVTTAGGYRITPIAYYSSDDAWLVRVEKDSISREKKLKVGLVAFTSFEFGNDIILLRVLYNLTGIVSLLSGEDYEIAPGQVKECRIYSYPCSGTATLKVIGSGVNGSATFECRAPTCTDSDGGKNYYVKGTTFGYNSNPIYNYTNLEDNCYGPNGALTEFYCKAEQTIYDYYDCPYGCQDGACVKEDITISAFNCTSLGNLKAQCNVEIDNLNPSNRYYVYVAGTGEHDKPAAGATTIYGSDKKTTVVVLTLLADTYKLGSWIFEGTNLDVIGSALAFWQGDPVEIEIK